MIDARGFEVVLVGASVTSGSTVMESEVALISIVNGSEASDWPSMLMGISKISVGCARMLVGTDDSSSMIELLSREGTASVGSVNVTMSVGSPDTGTPDSRVGVGRL